MAESKKAANRPGYKGRFGRSDIAMWICTTFICLLKDAMTEAFSTALSESDLTVMVEGPVMVPKFGMSTEEWCNAEGQHCQITKCLEKDKEGVVTIEYHDSLTNTYYDIEGFAALGYEKCDDVKGKEFKTRNEYYLVADEDVPLAKRECIYIDGWYDYDEQEWCYVPVGEIPAEDGSNLLTISDYIMASEKLGALPVIDSAIKTRKGKALDVCGGADGREVLLADLEPITAAEIALLEAKQPAEEGYEWALLGLEVNQHPAKKDLYCDLADEEGKVTANTQAFYAVGTDKKQYITIGDSRESIVKILPDADACGCLGDPTCLLVEADFTIPLTLEPNTAVEICPIYVCVKTEGDK
jgi:hypothetical protein